MVTPINIQQPSRSHKNEIFSTGLYAIKRWLQSANLPIGRQANNPDFYFFILIKKLSKYKTRNRDCKDEKTIFQKCFHMCLPVIIVK